MGTKGFFIRVLPFMATFTLGLFIASFFVSIAPSFGGGGRGFGHRHRKMERLRMENERLRSENQRLRKDLESRFGGWHNPRHGEDLGWNEDIFSNVPPVPVPPAPPRLAN